MAPPALPLPCYAITPAKMAEFERLAQDARPVDEEDWGSERQVDAENAFYDAIGFTDYDIALGEGFRDFVHKATTDEGLDEALRLLRLRAA